ncbi:hypothetical protein I5M27_14690 [Adhaeribacter sp. BT258]|uniref:Uncharacterized protein n=1 Tax=Adhaeribacter terrigena TaxID=2793070 RepID=A0ABS1C4X3_9BACT|nr:hypothetical protein [Adhaeribacter terrigena]MBK0404241.1 hypothetical protein [Adhaeribacter terrigena]
MSEHDFKDFWDEQDYLAEFGFIGFRNLRIICLNPQIEFLCKTTFVVAFLRLSAITDIASATLSKITLSERVN